MLYHVVIDGILQYEDETKEQAFERDRKMREHNKWVDKELAKWEPGPAKFYEKWCREHAPHLLKEKP